MKFRNLLFTLLLAIVAMPAIAKGSDKPIPLCVDEISGQPVKPKSSSGNCPKGSYPVPLPPPDVPPTPSFLRGLLRL